MIAKQELIQLLTKEFATTQRVMRAYPSDKLAFTPHERSNTAKKLMSTFIFEQYLVANYVFAQDPNWEIFKTYDPADMNALLADFQRETQKTISGIEGLTDEDLKRTITFAEKEYSLDAFIMMMLHDQIHHRGQLSVYVRMAGGKVPSIYGPSADDTSTNL